MKNQIVAGEPKTLYEPVEFVEAKRWNFGYNKVYMAKVGVGMPRKARYLRMAFRTKTGAERYGRQVCARYNRQFGDVFRLRKTLVLLKMALTAARGPLLILEARRLMEVYERELLPDWVAALAGGNEERWEAVLEEVLAEVNNG